jgi:hypothetical protein
MSGLTEMGIDSCLIKLEKVGIERSSFAGMVRGGEGPHFQYATCSIFIRLI